MGWFSKQVTDGLVDTAKGVADVVDKFVETPDERLHLKQSWPEWRKLQGWLKLNLTK